MASVIPNKAALVSLVLSTEKENCEADMVLPADKYKFLPGSKVSDALPPLPPVIEITDGDEFVAKA